MLAIADLDGRRGARAFCKKAYKGCQQSFIVMPSDVGCRFSWWTGFLHLFRPISRLLPYLFRVH